MNDDLLDFASLNFIKSPVMAKRTTIPAQSLRSNEASTGKASTKNPFINAFDEYTIANAFGDGDSI